MLNGCRKCRREGVKLILKGERCLSAKCAVTRRSYAPGDHGQGFQRKLSEYGKQLREKQKAKRIYGINETQFASYVEKAQKLTGDKTVNLMRLLESRVDNIVYRLGFASSRAQARQLVSHGHFAVNDHKITIPSVLIKAGDSLKPNKTTEFKDISINKSVSWLDVDAKKLVASMKHEPTREEIDTPVNESLIIEYYSR